MSSPDISSPDTWTDSDWIDFQLFGVCACGRLRRQHFVRGARGQLLDVVARCDAGHDMNLADV